MAKIYFKGNEISTIGELPKVGETAKNFTLVRNDLSEVQLSDLPSKKKVLNVVPSLDTGTCSASARNFESKLKNREDVIVLDISKDLPFAQDRFCKNDQITSSKTLSAFRSDFAKEYGVEMTSGPLKGLCSRAVIVLNENNQVIYTEQVSEITQEPNYDRVLEVLKHS